MKPITAEDFDAVRIRFITVFRRPLIFESGCALRKDALDSVVRRGAAFPFHTGREALVWFAYFRSSTPRPNGDDGNDDRDNEQEVHDNHDRFPVAEWMSKDFTKIRAYQYVAGFFVFAWRLVT